MRWTGPSVRSRCSGASSTLHVILNWFTELREKVR
jgi:hypothetical protein